MLKKSLHSETLTLLLLALCQLAAAAQTAPSVVSHPVCHDCISIRVGIPYVGRGPAADIADNHFTEIPLPGGRFRGFDAHAETRAIDGIHPWDMSGLARVVLTPGKPCWITEWGIANKDLSGPLDDTARAAVVADVMSDFRELAKQGHLAGVMYFAWNSDPWAKQPNADSVYRCGALTEGDMQALQP